jgi:hypothetical protein
LRLGFRIQPQNAATCHQCLLHHGCDAISACATHGLAADADEVARLEVQEGQGKALSKGL